VAAATARVVPVYFDCTDKTAFTDIKSKYGVSGLPAVVYIDPEGKKLKDIVGFTESGNYLSAIDSVAKKLPGRPSLWQNSIKGALALGKAQKKPVALYVAKEGADPLKITAYMNKNLGDKKTRLLWTWETGAAKVLEARGLEMAPAILIFDAAREPEELLGKATLKEGDDPKLLNQAIDEILKNVKK
jgi:hypothetical protein